MIEAAMIWNEPNNRSHWDFSLDPEWQAFGEMTKLAADAIAAENGSILRVLGGISPIDPVFITHLAQRGVLAHLDVVAGHGFPCDWNDWSIHEWPRKLEEIRNVTPLPVWVTEVGVSSFGAEEVQDFGLRRTAELLVPLVPRVYWYSLFDLPRAWSATTPDAAVWSADYLRHYAMGLLREDGTPKLASETFARLTPALGVCQWFHFEDHRLDDAVRWFRRLGVRRVRTGLSWSESFLPNAQRWFDRLMGALEEFDLTLTFCFTPWQRGVQPHHASPPQDANEFADFCAAMTRRYARR